MKKFVTERTPQIIADLRIHYPKVKMNVFSNLEDILKTIQSVIKSQTNIYDEKTGAKVKTVEKQKQTIYDICSQMSKHLGYNLNINTMTCMEFIGHENTIMRASKESNNLKQTKK